MALQFTDLLGEPLFTFQKHEYPESLPWNYDVKLNKIKYPDGHYTNQIIGVYLGDIEFEGTFQGVYQDGFEFKTAKDRSDKLYELLGKVVRIQYAIGGQAGNASTVVIESYERKIKNYWEVEYKLKLSPHEPQTRVTPSKLSNLSVGSGLDKLLAGATRAVTKPRPSGAKSTPNGKDTTKKADAKGPVQPNASGPTASAWTTFDRTYLNPSAKVKEAAAKLKAAAAKTPITKKK